MEYTIGEFSRLMGLGIHTLRYYEKENLILPNRKSNGHRCYSENDVTWVQFIKRLKDTKMPIKEIQKYAKLRARGNPTIPLRMEMLMNHRGILKNEIEKLQEHLNKLDTKIEFYKAEINKI
ncbi:MAG: MerR family transcriptional regulator [Termitinemataceae bacterium]|nr:MAG: MerR family transcriptional regulator [Termitinemataceae bacterium]